MDDRHKRKRKGKKDEEEVGHKPTCMCAKCQALKFRRPMDILNRNQKNLENQVSKFQIENKEQLANLKIEMDGELKRFKENIQKNRDMVKEAEKRLKEAFDSQVEGINNAAESLKKKVEEMDKTLNGLVKDTHNIYKFLEENYKAERQEDGTIIKKGMFK